MKPRLMAKATLAALAVLAAAEGRSTAQDIPIRNWEVPSGELSKQVLGTPGVFAPIDPPCRLYDSRVTSGGPGPIPGSGTRNFDFVPGGSGSCGSLPSNVVGLSLFFTVLAPGGPGFIYAWPGPTPPSSPTSIVNYNGTTGEIRNNAAIVTVDPATGAFNVTAGVSGTELIIDLNGVFFYELPSDRNLSIRSNIPGNAAIDGRNNASTAHSIGVLGLAGGASSNVYGVRGQLGPSVGDNSAAVQGLAFLAPSTSLVFGGHFITDSTVTNSAGVLADSNAVTGQVFGLIGDNDSAGAGAAGVFGRSGVNTVTFPYVETTGVLGTSRSSGNPAGNVGVAGTAEGAYPLYGVVGSNRSSSGFTAAGALAYGSYGVYSFGEIGAVGMKSFVEPHPTDPDLEIAYVSLEGNEAGTYFRGRGKFQNGLARIPVPEDFRLVSEAEGLSIQVTPIGEMASFAVVRIGLDEIAVKASRNVEFFYLVNGVRRRYADHQPIRKNTDFVPRYPGDKMHRWPEWVKERLTRNGTLTPEGTPNLETAEKLGWKAMWERQEADAKKDAAANREEDPK